MFYFLVSVLVLALLLFFPMSRLIWVLSVRRLQRKTGNTLTSEEIQGQRSRARFVAILVSLIFSLLFNIQLLGLPSHV